MTKEKVICQSLYVGLTNDFFYCGLLGAFLYLNL